MAELETTVLEEAWGVARRVTIAAAAELLFAGWPAGKFDENFGALYPAGFRHYGPLPIQVAIVTCGATTAEIRFSGSVDRFIYNRVIAPVACAAGGTTRVFVPNFFPYVSFGLVNTGAVAGSYDISFHLYSSWSLSVPIAGGFGFIAAGPP